jgi:hypothetical protein
MKASMPMIGKMYAVDSYKHRSVMERWKKAKAHMTERGEGKGTKPPHQCKEALDLRSKWDSVLVALNDARSL